MSICKLCFLPGNKFYLAENFPLALSMIFPITKQKFLIFKNLFCFFFRLLFLSSIYFFISFFLRLKKIMTKIFKNFCPSPLLKPIFMKIVNFSQKENQKQKFFTTFGMVGTAGKVARQVLPVHIHRTNENFSDLLRFASKYRLPASKKAVTSFYHCFSTFRFTFGERRFTRYPICDKHPDSTKSNFQLEL